MATAPASVADASGEISSQATAPASVADASGEVSSQATAPASVADASGEVSSQATAVVGAATPPRATQAFGYTGAAQTWQVPEGVTEVTLVLAGAGGANLFGSPTREGRGAVLTWENFAVTPGTECTFYIGEGGQVDTADDQDSPGGGAASSMFCSIPGSQIFNAVAGGGGGASVADGGDGGTPTGGNGLIVNENTTPGLGGSEDTPGAGGQAAPGDGGNGAAGDGANGGAGGDSAPACEESTPGGEGGANPTGGYSGGDGGPLCNGTGRGGAGGGGGFLAGGGGSGSTRGINSGAGGGGSVWDLAPTTTGHQEYLSEAGSGLDGYASVSYEGLPGAPTDLSAVSGDSEVTIAFTANGDDVAPATNYEYTLDPTAPSPVWVSFDPAQTQSPVTITGLTNGTEYSVALREVNALGAGPGSEPITVTAGQPAAPTDLVAAPGNESAVLSFTPGPDNGSPITNYQYSLDDGTSWVSVAPPLTSPPVAVVGLTNGDAYDILVRAVNAAGPGAASAPISVTPSTVPPAPTGLDATSADSGLLLEFTQPGDGGSPITNYQYSLDGGAWTAVDPAATTSPVAIGGLVNGTEYTVALRAVNANGVSPASSTVTGTPLTTPSAPTSLVAEQQSGQAPVSFTAPSDDGGAPITNYEFSLNDGTTWTAFDPAVATSPVLITGLDNGVTYSITLRAVNAAGPGASSASVEVTPAGTPLAPTNVVANAGVGSVAVSFTNADPNGEPILGYEYSIDGGTEWVPFVPMITGSPGIITGLPAGDQVEVSLRAFNGLGAGAASEPVPVTPVGVPGQVELGLVLPLEGALFFLVAGPEATGGTPLTNYEYTLDGGVTWTAFDPAVSDPFFVRFEGAFPDGDTYDVAVRALNAVGPGQASPVQTVTVGAPFPPFIIATPGDGSLNIEFDPDIEDNGSPVTALEYSLDGGTTWIPTDPALPESPIVVEGLENGRTYDVALRALNARGAGTSSAAIVPLAPEEAAIVTVGAPAAPVDLTASPGDGQVTVSFTPGADNGAPITNYEYSFDGLTWIALDPPTPDSPVTIDGLTNGTFVSIGLRGVNERGSGAYGIVDTTVGIPSAPTGLVATPGDGEVTVSFTPGADNGAPITNYLYSTDGGTSWTEFNPAQSASPVTITGLTNGTTYDIGLRAVNDRGSGEVSTLVQATPRTTPGAPTALTATPGYAQLSVGFTAPVDDGGAAISNYEYSNDGGATWTAVDPATTTSPLIIDELINGTEYQVALRAVNEAGAGVASAAIPATPVGAKFTAVAPYRAYDSRTAEGPLSGGQSRTIATSVPAGAVAVAYNLTATGMTGPGYLTVSPAGQAPSPTSTVNYSGAGQTWANAFISAVDEQGQLQVSATGASTQFVVDVSGYYFAEAQVGADAASLGGEVSEGATSTGDGPGEVAATNGAGEVFVPLYPTRVYDSREAEGALGGGQSRVIDVSAGGAVPAEATAITYTLTETGTTGRGVLSVGPPDVGITQFSTINWFTANQTTANTATVAVSDATVQVWATTSPGGSAQFIIDVLGYYIPEAAAGGAGLEFTAIDPARAYDSRVDEPLGPIVGGDGFTTSMAVAGVPASARAISYNLTTTGTVGSGYLSTVPYEPAPVPATSTINWWQSNQTLANGSVVETPAQDVGSQATPALPVATFAAGDSTQYLMDVAGYFTAAAQN